MGRLIVEQLVSAEGSAQDAEGGMGFVPASVDDGDVAAEQVERLATVDAVVLGAATYRMFASHWPYVTPAEDLLAGYINPVPKHVISNRLHDTPWGEFAPARLESGDAVESVRRLKAEYAGELIVWGSLTLAETLFEAGEVDILRLRIVPTLAGGRRSFTSDRLGRVDLRLVSSRTHEGGQVMVEYEVGAATG